MNQIAIPEVGQATPVQLPQIDHLDRLIDKALNDPSTPVETIERLLDKQAERAFNAAVSMAKEEIGPILKTQAVDFTTAKGRTHYVHEDMAQIALQADPVLKRHGLHYHYLTAQEQGRVKVTCVLAHARGWKTETPLTAPHDDSGNKNAIQGMGSTITFLQRYTLKAALGLAAAEDDDGRLTGGFNTVGEAQVAEIEALITEVSANKDLFLKHFRIEAVTDLPRARFEEARTLLRQKKKGGA